MQRATCLNPAWGGVHILSNNLSQVCTLLNEKWSISLNMGIHKNKKNLKKYDIGGNNMY